MESKKEATSHHSMLDTYNIDNKGVYYAKFFCKRTLQEKKSRIVYISEDLFLKLYKDTVAKLDQKKTDFIWKKIGHKMAARVLSFLFKPSDINRVTLKQLLEILSGVLSFSTIKIFDNYTIDNEKGEIQLISSEPRLLEGNLTPPLYAGFVKGILEEYFGTKQIVKGTHDTKKGEYKITVRNTHQKVGKKLEKMLMQEIYKKNFKNTSISHNLPTLIDFIKFKKVELHEKKHVVLMGTTMIPFEVGLIEIIYKEYDFFKQSELLKKSIHSFILNFIKSNSQETQIIEHRIKEAVAIFFAIGYGKIDIIRKPGTLMVKMHHPSYTRFGDNLFRIILVGTMQYIFDKKFNIIKNTRDRIMLEDVVEEVPTSDYKKET